MHDAQTEPPFEPPRPGAVASFAVSDTEPALGELVEVFDTSFDPGRFGIAWRAWDFGDGCTTTGHAPRHRYDAVGEHTITLTLATFDGRIATGQQVVRVQDPRR